MTKGNYSYEDYLELDSEFVNTIEAINLAETYNKIKYQYDNIGKKKKEVQIKAELNKELREISKSFT